MSEKTDPQPDSALLNAWVKHGDREAIGLLISRHINFVYAVALQQVHRDAHLAEDVTQAVFILLLQKAHRIQSEAAMASWLFTTTRYAAANAMKMRQRRSFHEHQAVLRMETTTNDDLSEIEGSDLEPVLNEAIGSLPKSDRLCVIMSFLQQKTHREVGAALGMSEEAARKRVSRAVERMREFLLSRGMAAPSAAIGLSLSKQAAVSAQFVESTLNVATLSHTVAASSSAITIAKGVSKMIFAMKLKAAAVLAGVLVSGLVTAQVVQNALNHTAAIVTTGQVQGAANPTLSNVSLGDGATVEFVGIAKWGTDDWHSLDGKPIAKPATMPRGIRFNPPVTHQVMIRVTSPDLAFAKIQMPQSLTDGSTVSTSENGVRDFVAGFSLKPDETTADLVLQIADGPWKTALATQPRNGIEADSRDGISATFTPLVERDGKTAVFVTASKVNAPWRVICKDINGDSYTGQERGGAGNGQMTTVEFRFDLAPVVIQSLELQVRPYRKRVTVKNITLDPAKPTTPEIIVVDEK